MLTAGAFTFCEIRPVKLTLAEPPSMWKAAEPVSVRVVLAMVKLPVESPAMPSSLTMLMPVPAPSVTVLSAMLAPPWELVNKIPPLVANEPLLPLKLSMVASLLLLVMLMPWPVPTLLVTLRTLMLSVTGVAEGSVVVASRLMPSPPTFVRVTVSIEGLNSTRLVVLLSACTMVSTNSVSSIPLPVVLAMAMFLIVASPMPTAEETMPLAPPTIDRLFTSLVEVVEVSS